MQWRYKLLSEWFHFHTTYRHTNVLKNVFCIGHFQCHWLSITDLEGKMACDVGRWVPQVRTIAGVKRWQRNSLAMFHFLLNWHIMVGDIYASCQHFMRHWQNKRWPGKEQIFLAETAVNHSCTAVAWCIWFFTLFLLKKKLLMILAKGGKEEFI